MDGLDEEFGKLRLSKVLGCEEPAKGQFTYYLLKKLQEGGGKMPTVQELANYVRPRVSADAKRNLSRDQTPVLKLTSTDRPLVR